VAETVGPEAICLSKASRRIEKNETKDRWQRRELSAVVHDRDTAVFGGSRHATRSLLITPYWRYMRKSSCRCSYSCLSSVAQLLTVTPYSWPTGSLERFRPDQRRLLLILTEERSRFFEPVCGVRVWVGRPPLKTAWVICAKNPRVGLV